jgi:hypothetical protein
LYDGVVCMFGQAYDAAAAAAVAVTATTHNPDMVLL